MGATGSGGAGGQAGGSSGSGGMAGGGSGAGGTAGAGGSGGAGGAGGSAATGTPYVYVSGYSANINVLALDRASGTLSSRSTADGGQSPSYLAVAPDKGHLYAVNETTGAASQVLAFSIDPNDGHLTRIDEQVSGGDGAPHLAVHPSGNWVAVAHYGSGHTTVLPIAADGTLGPVSDSDRGPSDGCGRAHQAVFDASGTHLLVPCLESNYVVQFVFSAGSLSYADPPTVAVSGGPRHLALHPSEQWAYVLSELESLVTSFAYDAATGALSNPQTIPSYETSAGSSAHIVVHPSGNWLYVSNRGENSIGLFSIDAQGRPHPERFERDRISTPRDFSVDPTGEFLLAANQNDEQGVLVYRIAPGTGILSRTELFALGGSPTFTTTVYLP